jgi:hypothetical protein
LACRRRRCPIMVWRRSPRCMTQATCISWRLLSNAGSRRRLLGPAVRTFGATRSGMQRRPDAIVGQAGYYLSGETVPVLQGTWQAAKTSAHVAVEGLSALLVASARPTRCAARRGITSTRIWRWVLLSQQRRDRRPGCWWRAKTGGAGCRCAHGNGTQAIFYQRDDVYFCSVHGDPRMLYPWACVRDEDGGPAREKASGAI